MRPPTDVIVVGAGPAGASAAYFLSRSGRRVLLLDRTGFPRDKSCGDGLTLPAVRILAEMGVLPLLGDDVQRVAGARVFMRGQGSRDFIYPADSSGLDYGLVVPRLRLDHLVCQQAVAAGAELWEHTEVVALLQEDEATIGVEVRREGQPLRLFAPVVVAADGAASRLAQQAGLAESPPEQTGFAVRGYFSGIDGLEDLLEIYMPLMDVTDRYLLPSYGWVFPTSKSGANIGVGIFERVHDVNLRELMTRFLAELRDRDHRFSKMEAEGPLFGAPLSFRFSPERSAAPGLVLVGDAAGMVSPFSGEGISYALESGKLAAEAIHRNLRSDRSTPDLTDYPVMLEKKYVGYFEVGRHSARRYLLLWHTLESTFRNDKPLFALCRKAALLPEAVGEPHATRLLDDVAPLIDRGGLRAREDLLAVGEILLSAIRRDWPVLARMSTTGRGDPGVPFRPALLLLLAAAVKVSREPQCLGAAAAVELGYLAAVAHLSIDEADGEQHSGSDDGRPANWGNMMAVVAGDYLLSKAFELSAGVSAEVTRVIADTLATVSEARVIEQRDAFRLDRTPKAYLSTIGRKTAILFELPVRLGALTARLSPDQTSALTRYGRHLGLAFELADQVLDLSGQASELVKLTRVDYRQGLYNFVIRLAASGPDGEALREILAHPRGTPEEAEAVLRLVIGSSAPGACMDLACHHARLARRALHGVTDGPARRTLANLAAYAVDRRIVEQFDVTL